MTFPTDRRAPDPLSSTDGAGRVDLREINGKIAAAVGRLRVESEHDDLERLRLLVKENRAAIEAERERTRVLEEALRALLAEVRNSEAYARNCSEDVSFTIATALDPVSEVADKARASLAAVAVEDGDGKALEPREARALVGQRDGDPGYSRAHAALGWSKLEAIARESEAS